MCGIHVAGKFARPRGSALVLLRTPAVGGSVREMHALRLTGPYLNYRSFTVLHCTVRACRRVRSFCRRCWSKC